MGIECHGNLGILIIFFEQFFFQVGIIAEHTSLLVLKPGTGRKKLNLFSIFSN